MPPPKRRRKGDRPFHDGRVTAPRDHASSWPSAALGETTGYRYAARRQVTPSPPPSNRYTPPTKSTRFRPGWHKTLGFTILILGVALASLNDVMMLQPSVTLLPGGHTELYLFAGVLLASSSTWWFGWYDRRR